MKRMGEAPSAEDRFQHIFGRQEVNGGMVTDEAWWRKPQPGVCMKLMPPRNELIFAEAWSVLGLNNARYDIKGE